jgi:spore coat protein H
LPWDYDGALDWNAQPRNPPRPRWQAGLSVYWAIPLHERFLRDPRNVDDLRARMDELRATVLSDAAIAAILERHREPIRSYISVAPDLWNLPSNLMPEPDKPTQWRIEYDRIHGVPAALDEEFDAVRGRPMPMWLVPAPGPEELVFLWSPSYDLTGRDVTYDFLVASSPGFEPDSLLLSDSGLTDTQIVVAWPAPGEYFVRVVARSVGGGEDDWQLAFNDGMVLAVE